LHFTPLSFPSTANRFTTTVEHTFEQNAIQLDGRTRTPDASPSNLRGKSKAYHGDMVYCGQNTRRGHHSIGCEVGRFMPIVVAFSILLAFSIDITLAALPPVLPLLAGKHLQVFRLVQLLIAL
jgi:hypothetical protein